MSRRKKNLAEWWGAHWIRDNKRWGIYLRDGFTCLWCGTSPARLCLDHLKPRSRGGSNSPYNLVTSCIPCNQSRLTQSFLDWAYSSNCDDETYRRIQYHRKKRVNRSDGKVLYAMFWTPKEVRKRRTQKSVYERYLRGIRRP